MHACFYREVSKIPIPTIKISKKPSDVGRGRYAFQYFFKYSYVDLPHFNALRKLCFAYALLMIC